MATVPFCWPHLAERQSRETFAFSSVQNKTIQETNAATRIELYISWPSWWKNISNKGTPSRRRFTPFTQTSTASRLRDDTLGIPFYSKAFIHSHNFMKNESQRDKSHRRGEAEKEID